MILAKAHLAQMIFITLVIIYHDHVFKVLITHHDGLTLQLFVGVSNSLESLPA